MERKERELDNKNQEKVIKIWMHFECLCIYAEDSCLKWSISWNSTYTVNKRCLYGATKMWVQHGWLNCIDLLMNSLLLCSCNDHVIKLSMNVMNELYRCEMINVSWQLVYSMVVNVILFCKILSVKIQFLI